MPEVDGVRIPPIVYGTAWKEDRTEALVVEALASGFRGVDTANQRKHYHEAGVGAALARAFAGGLHREDVFVQTKFTHVRGQDHRLPYDPRAPVARQVAASCASSLAHLGVERIDAYLLHGPSAYPGLAPPDVDAWRGMEAMQREGKVRLLGASNVTLQQLEELYDLAEVKPAIVQNRTFTRPSADEAVRAFCRERGIVYEGFSLLTAIPAALAHPDVQAVAVRMGATPAVALFAWCLAHDIVVLTGTTSRLHMEQDLRAPTLPVEDLDRVGSAIAWAGA